MTNHVTILNRAGQCLAAAALTAGLAFAAAPIARADWDIEAYDACIATNGEGYAAACCGFSGGTWHGGRVRKCEAAVFQSAPPPPPPPTPGPPALAPNQGLSP